MGPHLQTLATTLTTSHWQAVFKSYETTKLYRDPRRSFCCFPSQIWLEPSDIICLGVLGVGWGLEIAGCHYQRQGADYAAEWAGDPLGRRGRGKIWVVVAASCSQLIQLLQPKRPIRDLAPKCVGHRGSTKMWKRTHQFVLVCVPSGNLTYSYWKWP